MNKEKILAFVIFMIVGIISGIIYFICLKNNIKVELKELINHTPHGFNMIYYHLLLIIIMFILGILIIGYIINYCYLYFEFFTIGFSIAFYFYNNHFNGLMYGLLFNLIYKGIFILLLCLFIKKVGKISKYHLRFIINHKTIKINEYRYLYIYPIILIILIIINDLGLLIFNDYLDKILKLII